MRNQDSFFAREVPAAWDSYESHFDNICDSSAAPFFPPAAAAALGLRGNQQTKKTPNCFIKNEIFMVMEDDAECPDPHWLTDSNTCAITAKAELPVKKN